jgi:membrane protein DedA with SNARE-associated domain
MIELLAGLHAVSLDNLHGLPTASLFLIFFFATFVSEDAACLSAGGLVATGELSFTLAIASCFSGIVAGDVVLYWIGRLFGARILSLKFVRRFVSDDSLKNAAEWLERCGASAIFISRFVTGLRLPTYLAAGMLRTSFSRFTLYFVIAAAVWTPILVGSVAFARQFVIGNLVIAGFVTFVAIRLTLRFASWRGRRFAIGKLKRIAKWEFWPLAIFYFPVVCYILFLAIRHRSLTVFTCANPAIPAGGFVGESKNEIYSLLATTIENRQSLLNHRLIGEAKSLTVKLKEAADFMHENGLTFPIVVKPDAGERGKGVIVVSSHDELRPALVRTRRDLIVQEYFAGPEVSVFYFRYPDAPKGEIFSITEKVFPTVSGDGVSTLETLILRDPRAVCLADKYLRENTSRLSQVPQVNEKVSLINVGTHSRGAIFLDGSHFKTDELERAINNICTPVRGFYFGRFDIRFSSIEDLRAGRNFKIIELNGVTSESTNIYDPRYSLPDAYRILFAQWRTAFEIGSRNKKLGAIPTPALELSRSAMSTIVASFA